MSSLIVDDVFSYTSVCMSPKAQVATIRLFKICETSNIVRVLLECRADFFLPSMQYFC